ncbi:hypothetical protein HY024_03320 [Candidatus Curtissbacteria bacterium]|nr:hypothetical protein [Candidatus Curtissbacteria bacterium]
MKKTKLKKHSLDTISYTLLLLIIVLGALAYFKFQHNPRIQLLIIIYATGGYLGWALIYHHLKKDITLKTYLEYLLIAAIVLAASIVIFFR